MESMLSLARCSGAGRAGPVEPVLWPGRCGPAGVARPGQELSQPQAGAGDRVTDARPCCHSHSPGLSMGRRKQELPRRDDGQQGRHGAADEGELDGAGRYGRWLPVVCQ